MGTYFLRRFLVMLFVLWGVTTAVFFLVHAIPGDPVDFILGDTSIGADREFIREAMGLNLPLTKQYTHFLGGLVTGHWGNSFFDRRDVLEHVWERAGPTALLAATSLSFALFLSLPLGIIAALRRATCVDQTAMFFSLLGISVPNFWLGPLFILCFSVWLGWLPVSGMQDWRSLILPSVTLGTAFASILSRMVRNSMLETLQKEYLLTARAKGVGEVKVICKHALKNALNPVITIVGLQLGTLLAGTVVTERVFNWPGLGSLLIDAIRQRDYPIVQGCVLVMSFTYVLVNVGTDFAYRWANPRVSLERASS